MKSENKNVHLMFAKDFVSVPTTLLFDAFRRFKRFWSQSLIVERRPQVHKTQRYLLSKRTQKAYINYCSWRIYCLYKLTKQVNEIIRLSIKIVTYQSKFLLLGIVLFLIVDCLASLYISLWWTLFKDYAFNNRKVIL